MLVANLLPATRESSPVQLCGLAQPGQDQMVFMFWLEGRVIASQRRRRKIQQKCYPHPGFSTLPVACRLRMVGTGRTLAAKHLSASEIRPQMSVAVYCHCWHLYRTSPSARRLSGSTPARDKLTAVQQLAAPFGYSAGAFQGDPRSQRNAHQR